MACKKQAARKGAGLTSRDLIIGIAVVVLLAALLLAAPELAVLVIAILIIIGAAHFCKIKGLNVLKILEVKF